MTAAPCEFVASVNIFLLGEIGFRSTFERILAVMAVLAVKTVMMLMSVIAIAPLAEAFLAVAEFTRTFSRLIFLHTLLVINKIFVTTLF